MLVNADLKPISNYSLGVIYFNLLYFIIKTASNKIEPNWANMAFLLKFTYYRLKKTLVSQLIALTSF